MPIQLSEKVLENEAEYLTFGSIRVIYRLLNQALQSAGTEGNVSSQHLDLLNKKIHLIGY
jgi:hypothetical protein